MRFAAFKAPLALMLFQVAPPVAVQSDDGGALHLKFGGGGGQFEYATYGCEGELLSTTAVPFSTAGGMAEYWTAGNDLRVSGSAGVAWIRNLLPDYLAGTRPGGRTMEPFGAVQAAVEGRRFGIGFGFAQTPFGNGDAGPGAHPSLYMRIGSREGTHFRMDSHYPSFAPGSTGDDFRMGLGVNRAGRQGVSAFFGASKSPYGDALGLFGELDVPVSRRLALSISASGRTSEEHPDRSGGVGFRYTFGR